MKRQGRKKRRNRRGGRSAAAGRARQSRSVGGLPLALLVSEGLLHPSTEHDAAGPRVRASRAERAHVERLRAGIGSAACPPRQEGAR